MERRPIARHLRVKRALDAHPALDLGLAALNLRHDALDVGQFVASLPKHGGVLDDLLGRLALDLFGDVVDVVAAVLLVRLDELVEVALRPIREALREQTLLLELLVVGERLRLVDLALLFALLLAGVRAELRVAGHFVAQRLAVVVDLLV